MREISLKAPAKVNLFLKLLGKRGDGYHEIETIYQAISLWDTIHIVSSKDKEIKVDSNDPSLPCDKRNLVFKAASLLKEYIGEDKGLRISIHKRIPIGSGLGGGSSDAALTLIGINRLWRVGLKIDELIRIGTEIGADVPFFVTGWPCALGRGIGEILTPIRSQEIHLVLIVPNLHISTRWAYGKVKIGLTKQIPDVKLMIDLLERGDLKGLSSGLYNTLEAVCMETHPFLIRLKERLIQEGAIGALISGSGPAIFGIASSLQDAYRIASKLRDDGGRLYVVRSLK